MDSTRTRKKSYGSSHDLRSGSVSHARPSTNVLLDGYKASLNNLHERSTYRDSLQQRPGHWNVDDTVSMHLLMETALGDSQHYEVLSPEDIDVVKKELSTISGRIDATKRKLVLEAKLRDATHSVNRLNISKSQEKGENQFTASNSGGRDKGSGSDFQSRTEDELEYTRKCEELATDLWKLEKEEQDLNERLLEHTAGVLQITHKGYLKKEPALAVQESGPSTLQKTGAQPYSGDFGDQSYYRPYSQIDIATIDVNDEHNGLVDTSFVQHNQMIVKIETKVENLNARMRDMILELKPRKEDLPQPPRELADDPADPSGILWEQMEFLDQCLYAMRELQGQLSLSSPTADIQVANIAVEEKLEAVNCQLFDIMTQSSQDEHTNYTPPPEASGETLQDQLDYLYGGLRALERRVMRLVDDARASTSKLANYQERAEQYVSVIGGLWDILTASDVQANLQDSDLDSADDPSGDDFSLQAFSTKVQELHSRSIELSNHKALLTKQVQQQRELSDTADKAKDGRMNAMRREIEDANRQLEVKTKEGAAHRDEVAALMAEIETIREASKLQDQQRGLEGKAALKAEKEVRLQAEVAAEQTIQRLVTQLDEAREATAVMELNSVTLKSDLAEKSKAATNTQQSMETLEGELVRLQTELTFVKAELDGAYGSRAQRAAEVAADPATQKELDALKLQNSSLVAEMTTIRTANASRGRQGADLQSQIDSLQKELSETIGDYEAMTKASIEYEKEREQLEGLVDSLRDRVEELDAQLGEDKLQMLGMRSPSGSREPGVAGNTSTMVLKNEFKKMMRETRAEHAKALKAEQDERRRLEALVRYLRKEQPPSRMVSTRF
ncbi:hypothetical protein MMC13_002897 [Lambiella insularis]|nr:hypothetical protein [Lambiella insularis]